MLIMNIKIILSATFKFNSYKTVNIYYDKTIFKVIIFLRSFFHVDQHEKSSKIKRLQLRTLYETFQILNVTYLFGLLK